MMVSIICRGLQASSEKLKGSLTVENFFGQSLWLDLTGHASGG